MNVVNMSDAGVPAKRQTTSTRSDGPSPTRTPTRSRMSSSLPNDDEGQITSTNFGDAMELESAAGQQSVATDDIGKQFSEVLTEVFDYITTVENRVSRGIEQDTGETVSHKDFLRKSARKANDFIDTFYDGAMDKVEIMKTNHQTQIEIARRRAQASSDPVWNYKEVKNALEGCSENIPRVEVALSTGSMECKTEVTHLFEVANKVVLRHFDTQKEQLRILKQKITGHLKKQLEGMRNFSEAEVRREAVRLTKIHEHETKMMRERIAELEEYEAGAEGKIATTKKNMETNLSLMNKEIRDLRAKMAEKQWQLGIAEKKLQKQHEDIQELELKVGTLEATNLNLRESHERTKMLCADAESACERATHKLFHIESRMKMRMDEQKQIYESRMLDALNRWKEKFAILTAKYEKLKAVRESATVRHKDEIMQKIRELEEREMLIRDQAEVLMFLKERADDAETQIANTEEKMETFYKLVQQKNVQGASKSILDFLKHLKTWVVKKQEKYLDLMEKKGDRMPIKLDPYKQATKEKEMRAAESGRRYTRSSSADDGGRGKVRVRSRLLGDIDNGDLSNIHDLRKDLVKLLPNPPKGYGRTGGTGPRSEMQRRASVTDSKILALTTVRGLKDIARSPAWKRFARTNSEPVLIEDFSAERHLPKTMPEENSENVSPPPT